MQSSERLGLSYVLQKAALANAIGRGVGMLGRGVSQGMSHVNPTGLKLGLGGAALGGGMWGMSRMLRPSNTGMVAKARQGQNAQMGDLNQIQQGFGPGGR